MSSTRARAAAGSVSASSNSISFPWRTSSTPAKPRPFSALPIAWPCGSSTPDFRLIWMRAFIRHLRRGLLLHQLGRLEIARGFLQEEAEPARHLLIALLDPAEILAEAIGVHLLVGARIPQPATIRADFVGDHDARVVIGKEAAEFQPEIDEPDVDPEKQPGQEIVDPEGDLHDLVEIAGARPAEGGDVLLAHQGIA